MRSTSLLKQKQSEMQLTADKTARVIKAGMFGAIIICLESSSTSCRFAWEFEI